MLTKKTTAKKKPRSGEAAAEKLARRIIGMIPASSASISTARLQEKIKAELLAAVGR